MPNFLHASMQSYLDLLASSDAVPGGGSAAALAGAMGAALLCMSARFTVGRPRYADFAEAAGVVLAGAEVLRAELQTLVERDSEAYAKYGAAIALPKASDEEKEIRHAALQQATKASTLVPMEIVGACVHVLELAAVLADNCNPHLVSDVAVAAELASSGLQSAVLNVRINLRSLEDSECVDVLTDELSRLLIQAAASASAAQEKAYQVMQICRSA